MRTSSIAAVTTMMAVLLLVPGISSASTMRAACTSTMPMINSSTGNQATELMTSIRGESDDVATRVDTMVIPTPIREENWQYVATELNGVKRDINRMGTQLCELEAIRSTVPAREQAAIDEARPELDLMAVHTTDAIRYLNDMHTGLWRPTYRKFETDLQSEARELHNLMTRTVQYARARQLKNDLRMGASS